MTYFVLSEDFEQRSVIVTTDLKIIIKKKSEYIVEFQTLMKMLLNKLCLNET